MKRLILIMAACLPVMGLLAAEVEPISADTIITLEKKRIEVKDNGDRMKVRVYELDENGEAVDDEMVFEGHYRDGQSYERRKHIKTLDIPVPTFPFSRYNWALVTGAGLRWNRYRIDENAHFQEVDGVTQLVPAPEGVVYKKSKLNMTSLTIPVLLEWQTPKKRHKPRFFVSGGVVGVIKTTSSSKVVYDDERGKTRKQKMDGGMNLRPVTMDLLFQAGVGCIGAYFKYSPIEMFESKKGPALHPVSFGLQLHL